MVLSLNNRRGKQLIQHGRIRIYLLFDNNSFTIATSNRRNICILWYTLPATVDESGTLAKNIHSCRFIKKTEQ